MGEGQGKGKAPGLLLPTQHRSCHTPSPVSPPTSANFGLGCPPPTPFDNSAPFWGGSRKEHADGLYVTQGGLPPAPEVVGPNFSPGLRPIKDHIEKRLLDQTPARASYTPIFGGAKLPEANRRRQLQTEIDPGVMATPPPPKKNTKRGVDTSVISFKTLRMRTTGNGTPHGHCWCEHDG